MDGFRGSDIVPANVDQVIGPDAGPAVDLQTSEVVTQCDALLADLQATINQAVADCAVECQLSADGCQSCITNWFSRQRASLTALLNQCYGDMTDAVLIQMQEAASLAALAGVNRPSLGELDAVPVTTATAGADSVAVQLSDPIIPGATPAPAVPASTPTEIIAAICPPDHFPVTTADGRIVCFPTSPRGTGPPPPPIIIPAPPPPPPVPPPAVPPAPVVPPPIAPPSPFGTPIITSQIDERPPLGTSGPVSLGQPYLCIEGRLWTESQVAANWPELAGLDLWEVGTGGDGIRLAYITQPPDGWQNVGVYHFTNYSFPTSAGSSKLPCLGKIGDECACPGGNGTTVTPVDQPRSVHPFCNPNALREPVPPGPAGPPAVIPDPRVSTLGSDLATIAYQPTGNDAMDALTGILSTPIVAGGYGIDFVVNGVATIGSSLGGLAAKGLAEIVGGLASLAGPLLEKGACQSEPFTSLAVVNFLPSLLSFFGGAIPTQVTVPNVYAMNYLCPVLIPSGAELNALRVRGIITDSQWRIGVKANNLCPEWQEKLVDAAQWAPTPDSAALMERRGFLSYDEFKAFCRRNGVIRDADMAVIWGMTEALPGIGDVIRFMTRDAFDEAVVTRYNLDEDFTTKYTEEAKKLGDKLGYPERLAKLEWRSHWGIPSNTALNEMLHRLYRPWKLPGSDVEQAPITLDDIRRAVKTNDMSPFWVDPLLAISYRPLSNTDVRRGFEIGLIPESELVDRFRQAGSSPEDAEILKQFAIREAGPSKAKREGQIPKEEVLKDYRDGILGRADAKASLTLAGVATEYIDQYLATEDYRREALVLRAEIESLRKRYMTGEFQDGEAIAELARRGVAGEAAVVTVRKWNAARSAKHRNATVKQLCRWWTNGTLTADQFRQRVRNLGFPLEDALRIAQTCQADNLARQAKEAKALAKEAASEARRRRQETKQALREAEALAKKLAPCKPPPKPVCEADGGEGEPPGESPDQG